MLKEATHSHGASVCACAMSFQNYGQLDIIYMGQACIATSVSFDADTLITFFAALGTR